jgi:predicted DNA-binding transcriptional regulator YafY
MATLEEQFKLLQNILQDFSRQPMGLTTGDVAKRYGMDLKTARKYINVLTNAGYPIYEERQRYYLDTSYEVPKTLSLEESELLYVALAWLGKHHVNQWQLVRQAGFKQDGELHAC